ncbi:MAG: extracellular solute-binding protein [Acetobacteraceae bacterium]|nr:extracellular solute-binding protein [Acetobacteraceae bacterium]
MLARVFPAIVAIVAVWPATTYALTIVTRGEASQAAVADVYAQPFTAATEISVRLDSWDGGLDTLKARAAENGWDLVQVDADELAAGCADGTFEKLDWPAIGGKDHYQPMAISDCGVGAVVNNMALAWDREKFQATPNWADFWDVAKIPGKRGLAKNVRGALEFALLADGVAPNDVYKTLGSADGIDRAFRKLDQLKPYIVWWQTPSDAAKILGSGDVLMTATPSGVIATANRTEKRNFGIQFTASLYEPRSWAIMKGGQNLREARQFLYVTGAPSMQARLFRASGDIGLAKGVNDWLTPEQQAMSPTFQANASVALRVDNGFWRDNLAKLRVRFETLLAQ